MIYYIIIAILAGLYKTRTMYHILIKNNRGGKMRTIFAILLTFVVSTILFPLMIIDLLMDTYKHVKENTQNK